MAGRLSESPDEAATDEKADAPAAGQPESTIDQRSEASITEEMDEPPGRRSETPADLPPEPPDSVDGVPTEEPPDSIDDTPPDSFTEQQRDLIGQELDPLETELELTTANYELLSARIDALDRQFESAVREKEEFREGLLATISELGSTSDDRDTRFFEEAGFRYQTRDRRYALVIRGQIQADARVWVREDQDPVNNGFYLPRSRVYFNGWVSRPIEYQFSIQRGFNNINVLNAYVRFRHSKQMRLTVGRFKTPFTYDFYTYKNWQLLSPERSLFNVNFALNRNVGVMASGLFGDDRLEYAVGVFDGPRNSFRDTNSAKDVIAFVNFKPWKGVGRKNFNVGGSVTYGRQDNPLNPIVLRTSTNASTSGLDSNTPVNNANVPFLAFNDGVRELGGRNLWELHASLYYGPLTILAAWDSGYSGYSRPFEETRVQLPLDGFHVQVGYMLTGEMIPGPTEVRPARPFDPRDFSRGPGAWQLVARYCELTLGEEVFTEGLADPDLWTRRAQMIDVGLNWTLNRFTKVAFDWEHVIFDTPVAFNRVPELQDTSDLFWSRLTLLY